MQITCIACEYGIFFAIYIYALLKSKMAAIRHLEYEVERVSPQKCLGIGLRYICAKGNICTMICSEMSLNPSTNVRKAIFSDLSKYKILISQL